MPSEMTTKRRQLDGDRPAIGAPPHPGDNDPDQRSTMIRIAEGASDIYASIHGEWAAIANHPAARRTSQVWAQHSPALSVFASPAELVAAIGQLGDPVRSCALLSDLLFLAADDALAARAVLQALLPGLRRAAHHRWRRAQPVGPWRCERDAADDALSGGWEAITALAGQRYSRPAAIILRGVEGRLRRIHVSWQREASRTTTLTDGVVEPYHFELQMAGSPELQATAVIADALDASVLDDREAAILFVCGVIGEPVSHMEPTLGLAPGAGYRALARAREALRDWLAYEADRPCNLDSLFQRRRSASCRPIADRKTLEDSLMPPLLLTPFQAASLLGISRSKLYALMNVGQIESVTIGTSRRIPYQDLVRYVETLPRNRPVRGRAKPLTLLHGERLRASPTAHNKGSTTREAR
jgi:excisionase family DNA binding protein